MADRKKYPSALGWIDIETTGLPDYSHVKPVGDAVKKYRDSGEKADLAAAIQLILAEGISPWDGVEILEVALVVTDFDLKPYFGYEGVVAMNDDIKAALGKNPDIVKMHLESGLLKASKDSEDTLRSIEAELCGMLKSKTTQEKGEFMIAGSGVAAFDHPLIKEKMPELASWFHYAPFDIGIQRRVAYYLSNRRDVVQVTRESFQDGTKAHRAFDDVKAHIKEAVVWRDFYRNIVDEDTKE